MNREQPQTTHPDLPHSGGKHVPEGERERPVVDLDSTLADDAPRHFNNIPGTPIEGGVSTDEIRTLPAREAPPSEEDSVYDPNKQKKSRRGLLIGVGAGLAGIALAGGIFGANVLGNNDAAAKPRPVATAPANPGTAAQSPGETQTGTPTDPLDRVTLDNFPFEVGGKTYNGIEEFTKQFEVSTEQYPDPKAATAAIIDRVNTWLNYSFTPADKERYSTHSFIDENGDKYGGTGAVMRQFINPAFEQILAQRTDLEGSAYPTEWLKNMGDLATNIGGLRNITSSEDHPYHAAFTLTSTPIVNAATDLHDRPGKAASVQLTVTFTDNGQQNSIGDKRMKPGGFQGVVGKRQIVQKGAWAMAMDTSGMSTATGTPPTNPAWRIDGLSTNIVP